MFSIWGPTHKRETIELTTFSFSILQTTTWRYFLDLSIVLICQNLTLKALDSLFGWHEKNLKGFVRW